jgi:3-oxoacyl-[acyl-carrier-protein] synthase II
MQPNNPVSRKRVAVTGLGVVAPNGIGVEPFWTATKAGQSGIVALDRFDTSVFSCRIAGLVNGFEPLDFIPSKVARMTDRSAQFALAAADMAVKDSGLDLDRENRDRIGVSMGTGLGGILFYEEQILEGQKHHFNKVNPLCVPRITPNAPASYVAMQHGARGPNLTSCTACSSGNHGIGQGYWMVRDGLADMAICGGTEACIIFYTFRAFDVMRVMSTRNDNPAGASRPFDKNRDGFVMGEGAGVLVLEEMERAKSRGARIYGEVCGYGTSGGAHHIVMPVPDGSDAVLAMRMALDEAGMTPDDVDHINAHGTSTQANDKAETLAIKTLFGERAASIPITSTKSVVGHTIGAAGAIEAVACMLTLRDQYIPPTINYETPDPDCDLDYTPNQGRSCPVRVVLNNSFGFGNNNAVLVFGKEE